MAIINTSQQAKLAGTYDTLYGHRLPEGSRWDPTSMALRLPDGTVVDTSQGPDAVGEAVRRYEAERYRKLREPHEFFAFCQAQFPDLIECFRRIELVKAQFAKFAGKAED